MGHRPTSRPGMGCICLGICFGQQTFINSSELLVSLMALKHFLALFVQFLTSYLRFLETNTPDLTNRRDKVYNE